MASSRALSANQEMAKAFEAATATTPASSTLKAAAASIFDAIGQERVKTASRVAHIKGSAALFTATPSLLVSAPLNQLVVTVADPISGQHHEHTTGLAKRISVSSFTNSADVPVGLKFAAAKHVAGQYVDNATGVDYDLVLPPHSTHVFSEPKVVYSNTASLESPDLARKYAHMPTAKLLVGATLHKELDAFTINEKSPMFQLVLDNIEALCKVKPQDIGRFMGELLVTRATVQTILDEIHERVTSKINPAPLEELMTMTAAPMGGSWSVQDQFNSLVATQLGQCALKEPVQVFVQFDVDYAPY